MNIKRLIVCSALSLTGMVSAMQQLDPVERAKIIQDEVRVRDDRIIENAGNVAIVLAYIEEALLDYVRIASMLGEEYPRQNGINQTLAYIDSLRCRITEPAETVLALTQKSCALKGELLQEQSRAPAPQAARPPAQMPVLEPAIPQTRQCPVYHWIDHHAWHGGRRGGHWELQQGEFNDLPIEYQSMGYDRYGNPIPMTDNPPKLNLG